MTRAELGRLEREQLRKAWIREDGDFTPWLASDENLELISDLIGLDLQVVATEKYVGPFRADILCKDTITSQYVLIENQLEWTDHSHLGQLLTYAAGLKASTVVWIAKKFTPEHRAALDWLNEISSQNCSFFGLEVELWRIGASALAPKFNIVCQPNDWAKRIASSPQIAMTDVGQFYMSYWTSFKAHVDAHSTLIRARQPYPQNWAEFAIGRAGFALQVWLNLEHRWLDVSLVIGNDQPKLSFRLLEKQKGEIEEKLGTLNWYEMPEKKWCYISQHRKDTDPRNLPQWPDQFAWLMERLEAFHREFSPRIRALEIQTLESGSDVTSQ